MEGGPKVKVFPPWDYEKHCAIDLGLFYMVDRVKDKIGWGTHVVGLALLGLTGKEIDLCAWLRKFCEESFADGVFCCREGVYGGFEIEVLEQVP